MPSNLESLSLDQLSTIQGGTDWGRVRTAFRVGAGAGAVAGATVGLLSAPTGPIAIPFTAGSAFFGAAGGGVAGAAGEYLHQNVRR